MKIKITGIIIMVIFAGTLIFYTCGKSQPQTDNQIYIGVACYDQKDTFIEELVDAFKEQCSSMESKDYAISMTIMDASNSQRVQNDQIEQMINDGCNVLCVNLADRTEPSEIIDAAKEKDIPRILELLKQVLQIHADIRPDIFIPGTTKYTNEELAEMIKDDTKPIYVAADDDDICMGSAFCQIRQQPFSNNMVPFTSLFIDDLCVDAKTRGQHIGEQLFEYVKNEAKHLGCYEVTLNVWSGNTSAEKFYEKMGLKTKERQMEYIL